MHPHFFKLSLILELYKNLILLPIQKKTSIILPSDVKK